MSFLNFLYILIGLTYTAFLVPVAVALCLALVARSE